MHACVCVLSIKVSYHDFDPASCHVKSNGLLQAISCLSVASFAVAMAIDLSCFITAVLLLFHKRIKMDEKDLFEI